MTRWRLRRTLAGLLAAGLTVWLCTSWAPGPDMRPHPTLTLGLAGPFTTDSLVQASHAGVSSLLVEMTWREAEPSRGHFDGAYLATVRRQITGLRASGFDIALNTGLQDAPTWVLDLPGGRFVDQRGGVYRGSTPNLVFSAALRGLAQQYLDHVLAAMGHDVDLVRAGGGVSGELSYPYVFGPGGLVENRYWAFDVDARASNPVPAWRPGSPSPHGEAAGFLTWYLDQLVEFQQWQVRALRTAGYRGTIAMLYPSAGMRPGDFERAVATNLAGTSSAEINGEIQRGYDFARQIDALTDSRVAVYGTWGENLAVVRYLAGLAHAAGHETMAENAGAIPPEAMAAALRNAASNGLTAFYLIRASDLACGCGGHAGFTDVASSYWALASPA